MYKKICIILILTIFSKLLFSQNNFELLYGTQEERSVICSGLQFGDGNYLLIGDNRSIGSSILLKISENGEILDEAFINKKDSIINTFRIISYNNRYFIFGAIKTLQECTNIWMAEIDTTLEIINQKSYKILNETGEIFPYPFVVNDTIYTFFSYYNSLNYEICFAGKFDMNLDSIAFKDINLLHFYDAEYSPHLDNFILTGCASDSVTILFDKEFNKVDGYPIPQINEMDYYYLNGRCNIELFNDSLYLFTGIVYPFVGNQNDLGISILDAGFNEIQTTILGCDIYLEHLSVTEGVDYFSKNKIYVTGFHNHPNFNPNAIEIFQVDSNLNLVWEKFLPQTYYCLPSYVIATKDGGCLLISNFYIFSKETNGYAYILKLDSSGNLTHINGKPTENKLMELLLYPNPATDQINIRLGAHLHDVILEIYDISGKKLLIQNLENTETQIDISNFKSGTYIYKCYNSEREIETGKFVKE